MSLPSTAAVHVAHVERWAERGAGVALVAVGVLGLLAFRRATFSTRRAPAAAKRGLLAALGVGHPAGFADHRP